MNSSHYKIKIEIKIIKVNYIEDFNNQIIKLNIDKFINNHIKYKINTRILFYLLLK